MATGRKRIGWGIGIILLCLCLTSCAGESRRMPRGESQEPGYVSTISPVDLQGKVVHCAFLCGEELVYEIAPIHSAGGFGRSEFYAVPILEDAAAKKLHFQAADSFGSVYDVEKDAAGHYYTLETDTDYVSKVSDTGAVMHGYCVCAYDVEGELLDKWGISQWLLEAGAQTQVQELALDGQGNIYVRGFETLLMMSLAGQYQGIITEISYHMTCGSDGQVYYVSRAQGGYQLKKIDFNTVKGETVRSGFPVGEGMFLGEGGELWVFDPNGIYRSREGAATSEQIFSWLEVDVDGTTVGDATLLPDGRFLAVTFDPLGNWGAKTLKEAQPLELAYIAPAGEGAARKETITVAAMSVSEDMLAATTRYNREHPDYRVVIKEYEGRNGYGSREDAMAAMDMDLVAGAELDIISVDYLELEKYVSKGMLEDLGVYLVNDGGLRREDLVKTIVDAYTMDGKLVALPTWFGLSMITGKQSMLGERDCWSIEDMAAFYEKYQDPQVLQSASPQNMLEICMKFNQSYFVDWEEGGCDFDREEFYRLLEFAGRFSGEDEAYIRKEWGAIRQQDGQVLLFRASCVEPCFPSSVPQWFSGEEVNYIGYPSMDGKPGILLVTSADSYGILSTSNHKEQAWDYLQYMIQAKGESDKVFPVLQDQLDQMLEASMEEPYQMDEEGNLILDEEGNPVRRVLTKNRYYGTDVEIIDYAPLLEDVEQVRKLISLARPAQGYHEEVMDIILEEAAGYFAGDRGAEEAAALIQNRVQLYLDEQK